VKNLTNRHRETTVAAPLLDSTQNAARGLRVPITTRRVQFLPGRTWEAPWLDEPDTHSNFLLAAMLLARH
jgi:hypothetical protein